MQTTANADAVALVEQMVALGFSPSRELHADSVAFLKDVVVGNTRTRIHVFFDKPTTYNGLRLANFIIATQLAVDPVSLDSAPDELRGELEAVCAVAPGAGLRAIDTRTCVVCTENRAEFYVINGDAICYSCVEARRTQTNRGDGH